MDFVERWLSVSPDGGNGSFETATILAVLIVVCALVFRGKVQTAWYKRTDGARAKVIGHRRMLLRVTMNTWQARLQNIWR